MPSLAARADCARAIGSSACIDGPVSITEVSRGNNFDITYGDGKKSIRIVTKHGEVAILDLGSWSNLHFLDTADPRLASARILEYMIRGEWELEGSES